MQLDFVMIEFRNWKRKLTETCSLTENFRFFHFEVSDFIESPFRDEFLSTSNFESSINVEKSKTIRWSVYNFLFKKISPSIHFVATFTSRNRIGLFRWWSKIKCFFSHGIHSKFSMQQARIAPNLVVHIFLTVIESNSIELNWMCAWTGGWFHQEMQWDSPSGDANFRSIHI